MLLRLGRPVRVDVPSGDRPQSLDLGDKPSSVAPARRCRLSARPPVAAGDEYFAHPELVCPGPLPWSGSRGCAEPQQRNSTAVVIAPSQPGGSAQVEDQARSEA
jgi:hypothetical protein